MTSIGFIGAGAIPQAIVTRLVASGYDDVILSNSRGPATLHGVAGRLGVRAGTAAEAAAQGIAILSVPWSQIPAAVAQIPDWTGKIVVDTNNPLEAPTFTKFDLNRRTSSEVVASLVPGARVVKAFNHINPAILATDPRTAGGRRVQFYAGDDADAKRVVDELLRRTGHEPIDLGGLADGGALLEFPGGPLPVRHLVQLG